MNIVADRSPKEGIAALAAAWVAFLLALPFAEGDGVNAAYMLIGGLIGAGLVVTGFAAASRVRPMRPREGAQRARFALLAVAYGAVFGLANLGANAALAASDPQLDRLLGERFATLSPWRSVFAAPLWEEVAFRLFFLGVLAWIVARFTKNPRTIFLVSMGLTAVFFGAMHLFRPMPDQPSLALLYSVGIVLKTGGASLLLGWLFWRWGLPYAMLGHAAANGAHELLAPLFFG